MRRGLAPSAGILAVSLTPQTVSAALPAPLLASTVRAAMAASLGVVETTLVTGRVAALARESLKMMSMWQLGRAAAQILVLGLGTAAIATPMLLPGSPAHEANAGAGSLAVKGHSADVLSTAARASRLDRFGDPLPPRVRLRLGTTKRRHPAEVVGVDFIPDGKAVVSARADGFVHFWDPISGRTVGTIDLMGDARTPDQAIRNVTISADGRFMAALVTSQDPATHSLVRAVWIRGLPDGRPVRTIVENTRNIENLVISPDGATLPRARPMGKSSSGTSQPVFSFDAEAGPSLCPAACLRTDGKTLAISALGSTITLWDLERDRGTTLPDLTSGPFAPCFSLDSGLLAVNTIDGQAVIINRATGRRQLTARGSAYAFAPDGRSLAMSAAGGMLQVIDTTTGDSRLGVRSRLWSGDNRRGLLARRRNARHVERGVLRFFEAESGQERFANAEAHQGGVKVVTYTPDGGSVLTAGDDGTVRLWDARNARQLRVFPHKGRVYLLALSPDGRSLATAALLPDSVVRVWDLATGRQKHQWPGHGGLTGAEALAFSSDGQVPLVLRTRQRAQGA